MIGSTYVGGEFVTQMLAWDKRSEDGVVGQRTFHTSNCGKLSVKGDIRLDHPYMICKWIW